MGRGGDGTVPRRSARHVPASTLQVPAKSRAPSSPPPFTLGQLRAAVPPHCFRKSLAKSSAYLVADCLAATAIFAAAQALDRTFAHLPALQLLLWAVYAVVQGTVCTGIWVIAHECGHGAFSDYSAVNDSVGLVLHSALLVPYFSWKYSHSRHHAGTGSMTRDEVFAPKTEAQGAAKTMHWQTTTPGRLLMLLITLTLGWPLYLVMNAGSRKYKPKHANHFWPFSPVFRGSKERLMVAVSDVALLAVVAGLRQLACTYGGWWLITRYVAPYLVVNFWLVTITLLQHSHPALPHYGDSTWDWLKGACSTVDRDYGWLLNTLHHHIADTHVCHHVFSGLPHYHAVEATEALRNVMGPYAVVDHRNVASALWEDWRDCVYVAPDTADSDVHWYRRSYPTKAQ